MTNHTKGEKKMELMYESDALCVNCKQRRGSHIWPMLLCPTATQFAPSPSNEPTHPTAEEPRLLWRVWYDAGSGNAARREEPSFYCDVDTAKAEDAIAFVRQRYGGTDWTLRKIEQVSRLPLRVAIAMFDQTTGRRDGKGPRVAR